MISILKTAAEMERLDKLRKAALECYGLALSSTEQNVIELNERDATDFRAELRQLLSRWDKATTPEQMHNIQALFRGELRDYKDATHEQIRRLRLNLEAAASALEEFAGNAASRGDDHEKELKQALYRLDAALATDRLEDIRAAVRAASVSIMASFEQMRALNQLAIAQLKDEIRVLHQKIQWARHTAAPEHATETWSRRDVDDRIEALLKEDTSFCLVLVVLRNLKALASRNSNGVMEDALQSLQVRLRNLLGGDSTVGRWTTNQFVALLNVAPGSAMSMSREASQKLMEPYDFVEGGVRRSLSFQAAAGMVDHRSGADPLKFRAGLEKLSAALGGV